MRNPIARFKESCARNNGFTLIELVVVIPFIALISYFSLMALTDAADSQKTAMDDITFTNQGPVVDAAQSIHDAAVAFHRDNPDVEVNKAALTASGYLDATSIPSDLVWGVGQDTRNSSAIQQEVCVAAYSVSEQTQRFTASKPVEVSNSGSGTGLRKPGCRVQIAGKGMSWAFEQQ